MGYINILGLVAIIVMMIPNVIFAKIHPEGFENHFHNKSLEAFEQIGRIGTFLLMIINLPWGYFGFVGEAKTIYLIVNSSLLALYILGWIVCWNRFPILKAYWLSIVPSLIFIVSGITQRYILLTAFALLFAACHIAVSLKNSYSSQKTDSHVQ